MMMPKASTNFTFSLLLVACQLSEAFVVSRSSAVIRQRPPAQQPIFGGATSAVSTTLLYERKQSIDGMENGLVILPATILICIWLFSIPPNFRRARICSEEQVTACQLSPGTCENECITLGNWIGGIIQYYGDGGGVHFDFSVDKASQDFWDGGVNKE